MALVELNYIVTKKEFLTIVYAINKFRHYITRYSTFVQIDFHHTYPNAKRGESYNKV